MTWKGYFELDDYENRIRIAMRNDNEERATRTEIEPLVFRTRELYPAVADRTPTMFEGKTSEGKAILQALVDLAWTLGIKPKEMADFQRQNDAQRRHLEDMRALTFKAATAEPPK